MELNYIKRGTGYFQYEDRLLTAHTGDIFLIQPNLVHAILPAEQESMFYDTIVFHKNMLIGGQLHGNSAAVFLRPAPHPGTDFTRTFQLCCTFCIRPADFPLHP